ASAGAAAGVGPATRAVMLDKTGVLPTTHRRGQTFPPHDANADGHRLATFDRRDRRYTQIFRLRVPATEIRGRENAPGSVGRPDRAGPDDRWARHGRSDGHPACRSTSPLTGQRDPHLGAGRDVVPETLGDVLRIDVAADQRGVAD